MKLLLAILVLWVCVSFLCVIGWCALAHWVNTHAPEDPNKSYPGEPD